MIRENFLLVVICCLVTIAPANSANHDITYCYTADEIDEDSPNTLIGYDKTNVRPLQTKAPIDGCFAIAFGHKDGICRLRSQFPVNGPRTEESAPGAQVFSQAVSLSAPEGITKLSLASASKLFGEPRKHGKDSVFYTFDAITLNSLDHFEQQTYHIDMKFGKDGFIQGYRIRGIGVDKPQWIDK